MRRNGRGESRCPVKGPEGKREKTARPVVEKRHETWDLTARRPPTRHHKNPRTKKEGNVTKRWSNISLTTLFRLKQEPSNIATAPRAPVQREVTPDLELTILGAKRH